MPSSGHSQGEIAAAYVAGALSLRDAARGGDTAQQVLLASAVRSGGMASHGMRARASTRNCWRPSAIGLSVAAVNGRSAVVVSGEVAALEELIAHCADRELRTRRIDVDYASHSVEVEAIRANSPTALSGIEPRSSRTVFFSTVTGEPSGHCRSGRRLLVPQHPPDRAVRPGSAHASRSGYRTFIEVQPASRADRRSRRHRQRRRRRRCSSTSARRAHPGPRGRWARAVPDVGGAGVRCRRRAWIGVRCCRAPALSSLPTYAFERRRFWLSGEGAAVDAAGSGAGSQRACAAGCGGGAAGLGRGRCLTGRLSAGTQGWLADHAVPGWWCSRVRALSSWRSAPATKSAARWSTS